VFYDGMIHVQARMCATCIFRPGNLMQLNEGVVEAMVEDATSNDGQITCHDTLDSRFGAVCRGYFDKHRTSTLQIAERLGFIKEV
jgi:hypothetical protein